MSNKAKVIINGVPYTLVSEESEQYLLGLGKTVDSKMREILESGSHISAQMAAVLAAVNFCDENKKLEQDVDNLRVQLKDYIDDVGKMRTQVMEGAKEATHLKNELQLLQGELAKAKQRL